MAGIWVLVWHDNEGSYPIGYVLDRVYRELLKVPDEIKGEMIADESARTIMLLHGEATEEARTERAAQLASYLRDKDIFPVLNGWRNELWPVHGRKGELLFSMERAAIALLGTMRYGVHMSAYITDPSAPYGIKMWIPRRSANKSTFPSMLDNTVAGGLTTGEDPFECVIREADEEASLPDAIVRNGAKYVETVTYTYITDEEQVGEAGLIYPECQWVYDLELPIDIVPQPKDGEVEEFMLCDVDEIKQHLAAGKFKPNCALVTLDFFIRHGILTEAEEPNIAEIERKIHRRIPFPGPHQKNWKAQVKT